MWVIVGCVVLVLVGLLVVVRWGGLAVQPPPMPTNDEPDPTGRPPVGLVVRRYLWYLTVAIGAGVGTGILAAGAGGRLVMRLLAVTAGPDAQGQITEADQVVGRISLDGTLGFIVFTGLFFGAASGAAYLLLRRWLPAGRTGGSPSGSCSWSWPAPGWSPYVQPTSTSIWWGRGGCRWSSSLRWCCSMGCWWLPWPAG
jgi:hypothetical protein